MDAAHDVVYDAVPRTGVSFYDPESLSVAHLSPFVSHPHPHGIQKSWRAQKHPATPVVRNPLPPFWLTWSMALNLEQSLGYKLLSAYTPRSSTAMRLTFSLSWPSLSRSTLSK